MPSNRHFTSKQIATAHDKLSAIINSEPNTIRAIVAREALDHFGDNPLTMFHEVLQYGCQSGIITSLIYYADTHAFFDRFYDEIEAIRTEIEDNLGEPIAIKGDLKNTLAWMAFEETAFRILTDDLDMD